MAEIGVAGTIIALAGTAMKLCYSLYKIADAIGTARHEASLVAAEVSAFSHALNAVSKCVDKPSANTKELHQTVLVLLNCCNGVITDLELELCVQDLAHPFMSPSRWAKFRVRIIWLFQRPKVCFLRQSMESLKMSLHLLVSTMDFTEAVKMRAPSVIVDSLKIQVEGHMISSSDAAAECMRQEQVLMLKNEEHDASHQDSEFDPSASEDGTGEDTKTQKSEDGSTTGTEQSEASSRDSPMSFDDRSLTLALQKQPIFRVGEDTKCSSLEAQKMVHRLAVEMVQKSREPLIWGWNSSGWGADDVTSRSSQSRKGGKRFFRDAIPEQRFDEADNDPAGSKNDADYGEDNGINERLRKLEDLLRAQEQRTQAEASAMEKKPPVKFKDAIGRKFIFPWPIYRTWKGMEKLIKQAFLHVDVIGQRVHNGYYDVIGPDREIILPQVWETTIQPDWEVTMEMWPIEEPQPKSPPPPPQLTTEGLLPPRSGDSLGGFYIDIEPNSARGNTVGNMSTPPSSVAGESSGQAGDDRMEQGTWWARQTSKFKKFRQEEKGRK